MQHAGPKGSFFSARDVTKVTTHISTTKMPCTSRENAKKQKNINLQATILLIKNLENPTKRRKNVNIAIYVYALPYKPTKSRLELFYKNGIIAKKAVVVPIVTIYTICTIKQDRKGQSNREKSQQITQSKKDDS